VYVHTVCKCVAQAFHAENHRAGARAEGTTSKKAVRLIRTTGSARWRSVLKH
jgi:hypothetical protein